MILSRSKTWLLAAALLGGAVAAVPTAVEATTGWPLVARTVEGLPGRPVPTQAGGTSASGATCRSYYFPVTESATSTRTYRVFGQLCTSDPAALGRQPVQLLMHGGTYTHVYFDWPYRPDRYNYVRYMTRRGYTTLNIDRLGYGLSDHPAAPSLNFDVAGYVAHELVEYLHQGALGRRFPTVVTNGYSMGGLTAQVEAARYHDVAAVAVHAVGHGLLTARSALRLATFAYPALLDPKFSAQTWARDPAYVTSLPGKRTLFYGPTGTYDPAQLPLEERFKSTMSATELTDITVKSYTDLTREITAPVLWEPGRFDKIWCGTTDDCNTDPETAREASYYRPGVLTRYVVQDDGHATVLGYGAQDYMAEVQRWLDRHGIRGVA